MAQESILSSLHMCYNIKLNMGGGGTERKKKILIKKKKVVHKEEWGGQGRRGRGRGIQGGEGVESGRSTSILLQYWCEACMTTFLELI